MDEQRLHEILGQNVEVPDMINKKLEQTYAQLEGKCRPAKRQGMRPVRVALIAAALVAALCATATATYHIFRQEVAIEPDRAVPGILGDGVPSWEHTEIYDELGHLRYWPTLEREPVDMEQAQALLGDYLPESGYQWQIEDYTFTMEGYVLDETTGAARFYYSVEHPGGFGEGAVDWVRGVLNYNVYRIGVTFETQSEHEHPWFSRRAYVDVERSTGEKLCIMEAAASNGGWKAEDGLFVNFTVYGETDRDDDVLSAKLELPGVKSLPAVTAVHPETGELAAAVSAIAVQVDARYAYHEYPTGAVNEGVDYIALEYADGTIYEVLGSSDGVAHTDYGLYNLNHYLTECPTRLVDPSQVAAVIVDGQRYEVN